MLMLIAIALAPACNPKATAAPNSEQPPTARAASFQRTPAEIAALSTPSVVSVRTDSDVADSVPIQIAERRDRGAEKIPVG